MTETRNWSNPLFLLPDIPNQFYMKRISTPRLSESFRDSLRKTQQPINKEPPTNWGLRTIVGFIAAPIFFFSTIYFKYVFFFIALLMNTLALYEYDNCIMAMNSEDLAQHQAPKILLMVLGDLILSVTIISNNMQYTHFALFISFVILAVFQIIRDYVSKVCMILHLFNIFYI